MGPTEETNPQPGGLDRDKVRAIASRLREVRRRWEQDQGGGNRRNRATEVLDAVLSDLDASKETESEFIAAEDVDLGLAMVEEIFEAEGSRGFFQVIASIRTSLPQPVDGSDDDEELPHPVRFQPPPTSAMPRRRPKPKVLDARASASPRKGRLGWLIIAVFVIAVVAVAAFRYFQEIRLATQGSVLTDPVVGNRPLISTMLVLAPPPVDTRPQWAREEFDVREEEMASFTLEIRLTEEAVAEGDLNEALRHFAAAAAIDRRHPRVVVTGKYLIASMLREGDLAHDAGDAELAGKRVQSARDLARGLGLEDDSNGSNHAETVFEDVDPRERGALQRVVGSPVRLVLKTGDVVYGRADAVDGDLLLLDVYAGTWGGGTELSKKILASTIKEIRVY